MGTLYGYNLLIGRSIRLIMNDRPLIVDYFSLISDVSEWAMQRPEVELYDYVIVTKDDVFSGIVTIKTLLLSFAKIQADLARFLNPLTGLPGNHMINEQLSLALQQPAFSILYIDLDNFKAYNDTYGFKKGDEIIQETANILRENSRLLKANHFVGHIGGDDFIVIIQNHDYHTFSYKTLQDFDEIMKCYYASGHLQQQFVLTENRFGEIEETPIVTLSIAIVTNQELNFLTIDALIEEAFQIKKLCKAMKRSCYITNNGVCRTFDGSEKEKLNNMT